MKRLLTFFSIILAALLLVGCGKKYDVNFDLDGGTLATLEVTQTIKKGEKVSDPGEPAKDGYTFEGWFLDDELYDFDQSVDKDLEIKAKWELIPIPDKFSVTFDLDYEGADDPVVVQVEDGQKATKPADPQREGYNFDKWLLDETAYNFDDAVTKNITLKASWILKTYTVKFMDDEEEIETVTVEHGSKVVEPEELPTKDNHVVSWLLDGEKFNFNTAITEDIVLTLEWVFDYTEAKAALKAHYEDTIAVIGFNVEEDLELIDEINGVPITWTSNEPDFLANDGTVTRPSFSEGNKNVTLTATFDENNKEVFRVRVAALEETIEEKLEAILAIVTIVPESPTGYQEGNFGTVKKYTIGEDEVDIVWVSSDETVMTNNGELQGFEDAAEKTVELTATITYQEVTVTKTIEFLVKGVSTYTSFKEALISANEGEKIKVDGVAFYKMIKDVEEGDAAPVGFYVASDDNMIAYVHGALPENLKPNKLYDVIFEVQVYFGTFQLRSPAFSNERDGDLPEITPVDVTLEDIVTLPKPEVVNFNQQLVTLKNVKVVVQDFNDNYKTFLVDQSLPEGTILNDTNSIMLYYVSNMEVIQTLNKKKIDEIVVINNGYRTNNIVWYVNYIGDGSDIVMGALTAQEIVDSVVETLEGTIPYKVVTEDTLPLITEHLGATIIWEGDIFETVDQATGKVTIPATGKTYTLSGTIAYDSDGETASGMFIREITIQSPEELELSTTEDIRNYDDVYNLMPFKIKVIATGIPLNDTHSLQDGKGGISIFKADLEIGYEYTIIGIKNIHNGLLQITPIVDPIKGDAKDLPVPVKLDGIDLRNNEYLNSLQGQIVSLDNAEIIDYFVDNYDNIILTLEVGIGEIKLKWDERVEISEEAKLKLQGLQKGDKINVVGAPLGWTNDGAQLGYNDASQLRLEGPETAEEKVAAAYAAVELPLIVTEDLTLEVEGRYETVIAWQSSNEDVIAVDGTVTMPDANVNVILTATITSGDYSVTKEFLVLVQAEAGVLNVRTALELDKGDDVVLKGVVSGIGEGRYVYVSDEDGTTINLFYYPEAFEGEGIGATVGNYVKVTGEIDVYSGLIQVKEAEIEVVTEEYPVPDAIKVDKIPEFKMIDLGKRYSIDNLVVVSVDGRSLIATDGIKEVTIYSDLNVEELNNHLAAAEGKMINVVDIHLGWHGTNGQFLLYNKAQVVIEELTDYGKALLDLNALSYPIFIEEEEDLVLPVLGAKGSTIVWTSSHPEIISAAGVVEFGDKDAIVTLTATITVDEKDYVRVFEILVKIPISETKVVVTHDFTLMTVDKGKRLDNEASFMSMLEETTESEFKPIAVDDLSAIYKGNGAGGGEYEQTPGVLKTGTISLKGTMTLVYLKPIYSVKFILRGWSASDTVTINGVTQTAPASLGELEFVFSEATELLSFEFDKRVLIEKMIITYLD